METNPFVRIILIYYGPDFQGTFFVPDDGVLSVIYEKFGTNFKQILIDTTPWADFMEFWEQGNFAVNKIKFDGKRVDGIKLSGRSELRGKITLVYINGFLSTPLLSTRLKYHLHPDLIDLDDFVQFGVYHQDSEYFDEVRLCLYPPLAAKLLGFSNVEEMRSMKIPRTERLIEISEDSIENVKGGVKIEGQICSNISRASSDDENIEVLYLDKFPESIWRSIEKRVQKIMENLKEAKGQLLTMGNDIFQVISEGNLKGLDLISFCSSNPKINNFCNQNNQSVFQKALLRDFRIDWKRYDHGMTPKELYIQVLNRPIVKVRGPKPEGHKYTIFTKGRIKYPSITSVLTSWVSEKEAEDISSYIFFFPDAPELSFYAEVKESTFTTQKGVKYESREVVKIVDSKIIEKHLTGRNLRDLILDHASSIFIRYFPYKYGNSTLWYSKLVGENHEGLWVFRFKPFTE